MNLDEFLFNHCCSKGRVINSVKGKNGENIALVDHTEQEIFCMLMPGEYFATIYEFGIFFTIDSKLYEARSKKTVFSCSPTDDVITILKDGTIHSKELGDIWYVKEI